MRTLLLRTIMHMRIVEVKGLYSFGGGPAGTVWHGACCAFDRFVTIGVVFERDLVQQRTKRVLTADLFQVAVT